MLGLENLEIGYRTQKIAPLPWRERIEVRGNEFKCPPPPAPSPIKGEGIALIFMGCG
jgi:hypothetical protein